MHEDSSRNTPRRLRGIVAGGLAAFAAFTLTACTSSATSTPTPTQETQSSSASALLAKHGIDGLSTEEVIDKLEATPIADRSTSLMASIRPDEVQLTDTETQEATAIPMPEDRFYLSVAPYITQTHECYYHSLTTCKGELRNAEVKVTVTNSETGKTVLSETRTSADDGFVGLWLPRGIQGDLTIEYDGKSATSKISTAKSDDATCLTTMKLS